MVSLLPSKLLFNYCTAVFEQNVPAVWLCKKTGKMAKFDFFK